METIQPELIKPTPVDSARKHLNKALREFCENADSCNAPPEEKQYLAENIEAFANYVDSLNDGRGWISQTGWIEASYRNLENLKQDGVMVWDGKKYTWLKPSKKQIAKKTEEILREIHQERIVSPLLTVIEPFFVKYMQRERAQNSFKKKAILSEAAFQGSDLPKTPKPKTDKLGFVV